MTGLQNYTKTTGNSMESLLNRSKPVEKERKLILTAIKVIETFRPYIFDVLDSAFNVLHGIFNVFRTALESERRRS